MKRGAIIIIRSQRKRIVPRHYLLRELVFRVSSLLSVSVRSMCSYLSKSYFLRAGRKWNINTRYTRRDRFVPGGGKLPSQNNEAVRAESVQHPPRLWEPKEDRRYGCKGKYRYLDRPSHVIDEWFKRIVISQNLKLLANDLGLRGQTIMCVNCQGNVKDVLTTVAPNLWTVSKRRKCTWPVTKVEIIHFTSLHCVQRWHGFNSIRAFDAIQ